MGRRSSQISFVFPGQGSQSVGMLGALAPECREIFSTASAVLGKDLWTLAQQGPDDILNQTVNTQPVLLAASVALWERWKKADLPMPAWLAGHSLGEYSALVCANALSLEAGIKLVAQRGQFMQDAVPAGEGAMAALLGMENEILQTVCEEAAQGQVVSPANFNAVGQTVIAGDREAVERAIVLAKARGAKKCVMLPVSVPSHCAKMGPASRLLSKVLESIPLRRPEIPVIHNVDVEVSEHPDDIRQRLVEQLYRPVRWVETGLRLAEEGVLIQLECGPGKILSGLSKRIVPTVQAYSLETEWDKSVEVLS